jgi:hypothetical protein
MIEHQSLNHQSLGLSSCSNRSHLLAQREIQDVTPEAPVLAANRVLENDSGRAGKLVSAHQYSRADHVHQAVLEQVSAGTTEPATEMQSKTSLHLTHGYSRPRHSPMGLKGFMSHYGISALITRYTFQTISHLGEDDRSGSEYLYQAQKQTSYLPISPLNHHKSSRRPQGPNSNLPLSSCRK